MFTTHSPTTADRHAGPACPRPPLRALLRLAWPALALGPACEIFPPLFDVDEAPTEDPAPSLPPPVGDLELVAQLPANVRGICLGADALFATHDDLTIAEYDLDTYTQRRVWTTPAPPGPSVIGDCVVDDGHLYYADVGLDAIGRIDLVEDAHLPEWAPSPGERPRAVTVDADGRVWVSADDTPDLYALDPASGRSRRRFRRRRSRTPATASRRSRKACGAPSWPDGI